MPPDLERVQSVLADVEADAASLPWYAERPWTLATHTGWDRGAVVLDLHDLSTALALRVVERVGGLARSLDGAAAVFVTGRGRHSISGRSALRSAVRASLVRLAGASGWEVHVLGPARLALVVDRSRAPAHVTGRLGWGCGLGVAAFVALSAWAFPPSAVVLVPLAVAGWWFLREPGGSGRP